MKKRLIVGAALVAAGAVQAAVVTSWQESAAEATIQALVSSTDAAAGLTTERDFTGGNFNAALTTDGVLGGSFNNNPGNGTALVRYKIDLGASVEIGSVNSFSYGNDGARRRQKFTLYGSTTDTPSFDETDTGTWTAIGSFDNTSDTDTSDAWGVSSISDDAGSLGTYREVMWVASPGDGVEGTIYKEFDVIAIPEPATLGLIAAFGGSLLFIRRRFMI